MTPGVNETSQADDRVSESIPSWLATMCCTTIASSSKPEDQNAKNVNDSSSIDVTQPRMSDEEIAKEHAMLAQDDPNWLYLVNLGAVGIIIIYSFLWGYYA